MILIFTEAMLANPHFKCDDGVFADAVREALRASKQRLRNNKNDLRGQRRVQDGWVEVHQHREDEDDAARREDETDEWMNDDLDEI